MRKPCKNHTLEIGALKICTWNVRTLYQAGKTHNAIQEMKRLGVDIMGVSEMRWTGSGQQMVDDHVILYSGNENEQHINGVGVILSPKLKQNIINFIPVSERIIAIQLDSRPIKLNLIQVYAPTADRPDEEVETFYETLESILGQFPKEDVTLIMGDFNAKIGKDKRGEFIGEHGLGNRNERGERMKLFVEQEEFVVLNTFFKLPPRRLYTWISPQDTSTNITRNQIDYLLVNKRFRNSCQSAKTYPGADISSDHCPLVGKFKIRLKRIPKKTDNRRWDMRRLKEEEDTRQMVTEKINKACEDLKTLRPHDEEIVMDNMRQVFTDIGEEHLKPKNIKKKQWMTEEILQLMDDRRRARNDEITYKALQKQIKHEIRMAKERWIKKECEDIEVLQEKHDLFNLHKKVKEAAGIYKQNTRGTLYNEHGKIIIEKKEKISIWKQYITELFEDNRQEYVGDLKCMDKLPITPAEVEKAIKQTKHGKAPGPDKVHSEFIQLFDADNTVWLTKIFNNIYETGNIPKTWLRSTFITLPKQSNAKRCTDYRTISLMSHLLKIFLRIIHQRIFKTCEEQISRTQFGFRNALGTREALFSLQVMIQRCRDVQHDVFACFVDYQKAFDKVQHHKLMEILHNTGLEERDIRIIRNLYWYQTAVVRVEGEESEEIEIRRGVRQGCVLSPLLFNLYSETIFREALDEVNIGIGINGECINNIRYADDTVVLANNIEDLQALVTSVVNASERYGLSLNTKKTKFMIIAKNSNVNGQLFVNNQQIERTQKYTYLGTTINEEWDHSLEVRCRIEKARAAFRRMSKLFTCHDLSLQTKVRLLKSYVFPVLMYGVESWTVTEASCRKLDSFEMWLYRRILRIPWTAHVTDLEVLTRMDKEREVVETVKIRKLEYLGHIMRNSQRYELLQLILQGKIDGRRGPGRRRHSWMKNLRMWFNQTTTGLFRAAVNKIQIAMMIANIRNG